MSYFIDGAHDVSPPAARYLAELNEAFCSQKGLKSLKVVITNDQFEECAQKFHCWIPMTSEHREALMLSEKFLINNITINDGLLRRLSLCKRRRQAIESAATGEEQVMTFIDIVSRQPDSAFTRLLGALNRTHQSVFRCMLAELYILQQVSEEVNRKCPARNTTVQLSTPYTDPERHNALRHRQPETDRRTTASCQ